MIQTYTYYFYEKKSVAEKKSSIVKYYCCLDCFDRLAPKEAFKYPMNKIILQELPSKERKEYWVDMSTGQTFNEMQFKRAPLNVDAFSILSQE